MKAFRRFQSLFMSIVMVLSASGITAHAAEMPVHSEEVVAVYDFDITADETAGSFSTLANVDNTFYVYNGSHTGSTRQYYGNKLRYSVTITDSTGNAVDNILAIQLYDSSNIKRHEGQFWADGALNIVQDFSISSGGLTTSNMFLPMELCELLKFIWR